MLDGELGRIARAIRRRRHWRQQDVAQAAGMHRSTISILECGGAGRLTINVVRRIFDALGGRLDVRALWNGPELDRLLDERHAALAAAWKARLERWGWVVRPEVSYSRYGERGRIDLLGWHPVLRVLLVIEIKTAMVDTQGLLGPLDVKTRLARWIAGDLEWTQPRLVLPVIIFREESTTRRRVAALAPLFAAFDMRGRSAVSWLRAPMLSAAPSGLLVFSDLSYAGQSRAKPVGRERVRVTASVTSTISRRPGPRAPTRLG
jgi:transcriptional regulator with XRE-family HTH domain